MIQIYMCIVQICYSLVETHALLSYCFVERDCRACTLLCIVHSRVVIVMYYYSSSRGIAVRVQYVLVHAVASKINSKILVLYTCDIY